MCESKEKISRIASRNLTFQSRQFDYLAVVTDIERRRALPFFFPHNRRAICILSELHCLIRRMWTGLRFRFCLESTSTRKFILKNKSVNTHPGKQYPWSQLWFTWASRISRFQNDIFHLTSSLTPSPFSLFACLALPPVLEACYLIKGNKDSKLCIERPICHNCQIVLISTFKYNTGKINEAQSARYITFSFFPLFGILVIHLASVNGKHSGDKHGFCSYDVGQSL